MLVAGGATDVKTYFSLRLTADNTAATGLTPSDFDLQYVRSGVAPVAKVDATALAATDSAHADNKVIEIDATDQPGLYRVDWPDAAFAAGVDEVILTVKVATAYTEHLRVELDRAATAIENAVWDALLTGSTHNIATSAGRRLRQVEAAAVHASGVIATVTDGHTFTLDVGAVATADYYVGDRLDIIEGTGIGQSRLIAGYTAGRVVTLDSDFTTNPDTSSLYDIVAADVHVSLSDADMAAGFVAAYTNTTTITLDSAAVGTADYYNGQIIVFTHGTGAGQAREITDYTAGRVVTMRPALETAVDTTTTYHIQATPGDVLLKQMVEAYAADGVAPTLAQALFAIMQQAGEFAITGTTLSVKKIDGLTEVMTFTLNDASNPTSRTRAS